MENIKCIFCNKSSEQIVIEENGYKGRKCSQCDLIFISPRQTFSEILNLYVNDQGLTSANMHMSDAFVKRLHARHNINIIKKYRKDGAILEIGSGAGYFLDEARKKGFEAFGIEPNKIASDFVNNTLKIPCEETALQESTFGGKKFDIIYHCNVLSHLYDPIEEFKKINIKLKDNGILVFETGNIGDVKEKYYRFFYNFGYPDHLFFFGENTLNKLIELTDFEFIKMYRYSILIWLLTQKFKIWIRDSIKSMVTHIDPSKNSNTTNFSTNINSAYSTPVKSVYRTILHFIRYKIGYILPKKGWPQTVIVVARKK